MGLRDHGLKTLRPGIPKPNQTFLPFQWKRDFVTATEANTSYKFDCSFLWLFFSSLPVFILPWNTSCFSLLLRSFSGKRYSSNWCNFISWPCWPTQVSPVCPSLFPQGLYGLQCCPSSFWKLLGCSRWDKKTKERWRRRAIPSRPSHPEQVCSGWLEMFLVPWKGLFMVVQGRVLRKDKLLQDLVKRSLSHARHFFFKIHLGIASL